MKSKNIVLFIVLFISHSTTLPGEEKKGSKSLSLPKTKKLFFKRRSTEPLSVSPCNPLEQKSYDTALITATRNNDNTTVHRLLMDDIDLNKKGDVRLTALQIAAQNKNGAIIQMLLKKPKTNASIKTVDGHTARELVIGDEKTDMNLRANLFARVSLEISVDTQCYTIKKDHYDDWDSKNIGMYSACVINALKEIQESISSYEKAQATSIPDESRQPSYVDDTFILCMIMYRLYQ